MRSLILNNIVAVSFRSHFGLIVELIAEMHARLESYLAPMPRLCPLHDQRPASSQRLVSDRCQLSVTRRAATESTPDARIPRGGVKPSPARSASSLRTRPGRCGGLST